VLADARLRRVDVFLQRLIRRVNEACDLGIDRNRTVAPESMFS